MCLSFRLTGCPDSADRCIFLQPYVVAGRQTLNLFRTASRRSVHHQGNPAGQNRRSVPHYPVRIHDCSPLSLVQGGKALIVLKGSSAIRKDFYWVDPQTGLERQLTDLKTDSLIQNFDVTPDGKQIVFDQVRNNSDLLLLDLRQ